MKDFLDKAPFVRLLPALLLGIFLQYYFELAPYNLYIFIAGLILVFASFLVPAKQRFYLRPLFGIGISLLICSIGIFRVAEKENQVAYPFLKEFKAYIGTINEVPQSKTRSIACNISLDDNEKHKIVCYFQPDSMSRTLMVGDKVMFYSEIRPFKNRGNPDDFDYVSYMKHLGFSGTAYVGASRWEKLPSQGFSIYAHAQKVRKRLLDFYRTLDLGHDNFAVFSALTLGYMDELDDSVQQAFRATGTSHILSVSGLHVAIIYMVIALMLGFMPKTRKMTVLKQLIIILLLWLYAFLTGLPPSVVRATLMITVFCVAIALRRKAFSYNTVCFAAFVMLIYNPYDFFNVGFQLSFAAVLSICFFLPPILNVFHPQNKVVKLLWETLAVSLAVQLGTFSICLYYFGTFPTYFFLTNLIIVPLSTLVMYSSLGVYVAALLAWIFPAYSHSILFVPVWVLKMILTGLLRTVSFFESLPSALIQNVSITLPQMFLLLATTILLALFFKYKRPKVLMLALSAVSIFLIIGLPVFAKEKDLSVYVFNRNDKLKIGRVKQQNFIVDTANRSPYILTEVANKKIAVVKSDDWIGFKADVRFPVDYLLLSGHDSVSMYHLNKLFDAKLVILDGTLPARFSRRLQRECKKLQIECYDVKEKGAFRIKNY